MSVYLDSNVFYIWKAHWYYWRTLSQISALFRGFYWNSQKLVAAKSLWKTIYERKSSRNVSVLVTFIFKMPDLHFAKILCLNSSLREKCPYSAFFWFAFSPNAGKCGPEKLQAWTIFTQCILSDLKLLNGWIHLTCLLTKNNTVKKMEFWRRWESNSSYVHKFES